MNDSVSIRWKQMLLNVLFFFPYQSVWVNRFRYWKQLLEHLLTTTFNLSIIQTKFVTNNFRNFMYCLVLENTSLKTNKYKCCGYQHLKVKDTLSKNYGITINKHKISLIHQFIFEILECYDPKDHTHFCPHPPKNY